MPSHLVLSHTQYGSGWCYSFLGPALLHLLAVLLCVLVLILLLCAHRGLWQFPSDCGVLLGSDWDVFAWLGKFISAGFSLQEPVCKNCTYMLPNTHKQAESEAGVDDCCGRNESL